MIGAVALRPHLWVTAGQAAIELAPRGWWKRAPFLPLPDPDWAHFRVVTAYGGDGSMTMRPEDLVSWLEWKRKN